MGRRSRLLCMATTTNPAPTDEFVSLAMCQDCTALHANGTVPEDWADIAVADWLNYIEQNLEGLHGVHVGTTEDEFSTTSCDSCGTTLAGYRNHGGGWMTAEGYNGNEGWGQQSEYV